MIKLKRALLSGVSGRISAAVALTAIVIAGPAMAADAGGQAPSPRAGADVTLSDVVVTATRTGETALQKTPIAISAFSAERLAQSGLTNVHDLVGYVPNLSITQATTYAQIYVRGIGSSNTYGGSDPSVTVQVDGVYLGRPYAQFADLLDVERIEVLRGPQGTLYGRNATGGAINIISKRPSDDFKAAAVVGFGDYGQAEAQAYVSGPLIAGKLQGSLAFSHVQHDDYIDNIISTGNGIFNENRTGVRGQLRFLPTDRIDATTRFDLSTTKEHTESFSKLLLPFSAATNSIFGDYSKVALNQPNNDQVRTGGVSEDINIKLSDTLNLRSVTAYRENRNSVYVDSDDSEQSITRVHQAENQNQFSSELNLIGNYDRFNFVAGAYYLRENVHTNVAVSVFAAGAQRAFMPVNKTEASAVFAQATYRFTDSLSLTAGGRYTTEHKSMDQFAAAYVLATGVQAPNPTVFSRSQTFDAFTPKLSLQWQPNANVLAYASITRGFKSGGFNFSATSYATSAFAPEKVTSYEIGAKTDWYNHRLRVNVTGFFYNYTDLQQFLATAPGVAVIANAATAEVKGLELEISAKPVQGLELGVNLAALDSEYTKYPAAPLPQTLGPRSVDATGNRLNSAPPYSASLFGQQTWSVGNGRSVFIRGEYLWQDEQFNEPTNYYLQRQPPYGLVNLTAGLKSDDGRWKAELWVRNAGDEKYLTGTQDAGATFSGQPGAPRTFGLRLSANWN